MKIRKDWFNVRVRRVDNNEWKHIHFYGFKIQLLDKDFNKEFIMKEKEGKYYLSDIEVKPETLEYLDGDFKKLELKENLIREYNRKNGKKNDKV